MSSMVSSQPQIISRLTTLLSERLWFIYKQLANTLIADPLTRMYDALLIQLEKNRVPLTNSDPYTFDFGPNELTTMVGLSKGDGNLVLRKLLENKELQILNDKIQTRNVTDIVKQAEFYQKMQRIEQSRRSSSFRGPNPR